MEILQKNSPSADQMMSAIRKPRCGPALWKSLAKKASKFPLERNLISKLNQLIMIQEDVSTGMRIENMITDRKMINLWTSSLLILALTKTGPLSRSVSSPTFCIDEKL